jgi:hypothetical protein
MALNDALLADNLKAAYETKLAAAIDEPPDNLFFTNMSQEFKDKFLGAIAEANAEEFNRHMREHAEVKVVLIGLDGGSSLPGPVLAALSARGDSPPFSSDAGLQNELGPSGPPAPTTPAATSAVLSVPAVIE